MRRFLPFLLVIIVSCSPQTPEQKPLQGKDVPYYGGVEGYVSIPAGEGPFPAVVLIHEWWGLNDQIRRMADRFADAGYVALAVDLYNGRAAAVPDDARTFASDVRGNEAEAFRNLKAAVEYVKTLPEVDDGKLASVGWCFGGGWSYQMAKNNMGIDATVMYYGQFNPEDDLEQMVTHIQGHFGAKDTGIPVDDVKAFRAKLETLSGEHQIFIYENAGHGFMNAESTNYEKESAEKAWERTMEFLEEVF